MPPTALFRPIPPAPVLPPHRAWLSDCPPSQPQVWLAPSWPGGAVFAAAPRASAHGVPEKVVDDLVVSLVLIRVHDTNALRFFFRDLRSGRPLAIPVTFRVRLRDEATGAQVEESPRLTTMIGRGEFVPRVPRDGVHEVLLEVEACGPGGPRLPAGGLAGRDGRAWTRWDGARRMDACIGAQRPRGRRRVAGMRHRQRGLGAHKVLA